MRRVVLWIAEVLLLAAVAAAGSGARVAHGPTYGSRAAADPFVATRTLVISGRVIDQDGNPIPGVLITATTLR